MAQTPEQRIRNAKFAKSQDAARGKPGSAIKKKEEKVKSPVSTGVLALLAFVLVGGLLFELFSRFFL